MSKKEKLVDFSDLLESLPPFVSRQDIQKVFGSIISPKTMATYDSIGIGCKHVKIGRKVVYKTSDFVEWMEDRATQNLMGDPANLKKNKDQLEPFEDGSGWGWNRNK